MRNKSQRQKAIENVRNSLNMQQESGFYRLPDKVHIPNSTRDGFDVFSVSNKGKPSTINDIIKQKNKIGKKPTFSVTYLKTVKFTKD